VSIKTSIEWTDATWNPWHGCHKVSQGCKECYMFREKKMYGQDPNVVVRSKTKFREPLSWKDPRMVFTCSWSDWLIEEADAWREEAYDIIRRTPHLTYQILTKRIERATGHWPMPPFPHVWLGVSVENQETADERIPLLLNTPAAIRFVSYEPALGPVDFVGRPVSGSDKTRRNWLTGEFAHVPFRSHTQAGSMIVRTKPKLDWLIVGGESGPNARPPHPQWFRDVRDQCQAAGVPFFFKQFGEWAPWKPDLGGRMVYVNHEGIVYPPDPLASQPKSHLNDASATPMVKVGKKKADALLDGREWREFPNLLRTATPLQCETE
jgi:protein gp37